MLRPRMARLLKGRTVLPTQRPCVAGDGAQRGSPGALPQNSRPRRIERSPATHEVGPRFLLGGAQRCHRKVADAGRGVSRRTVRTCKKPPERGLAGGSCQPSDPRVSGEKSWLPDEDSKCGSLLLHRTALSSAVPCQLTGALRGLEHSNEDSKVRAPSAAERVHSASTSSARPPGPPSSLLRGDERNLQRDRGT